MSSPPRSRLHLRNISPVLIIPKHMLDKTASTSVLMNYCMISDKNTSDVALLAIGLGGIMNHGGADANVQIKWHSGIDKLSSQSIQSLGV